MNYVRHVNAFFSFVRSDKRLTASHVSLYMALFYYWNFNRFHNPFSIYRENLMQLSKIGSKNTYHKCIKELHEAKYIYYHQGTSKFQVVRISIVRLDKEEETPTPYTQLNLFSEKFGEASTFPSPKGEGGRRLDEVNTSTDFDTGTVPKSVPASPNIDTGTVSKMGHSINQTNNKQNSVAKTHTKIFEKNKEINQKLNALARVPKSVPAKQVVTLSEVEEFFIQKNSTTTEAHKFFYYNQAKNWMLTEKLPIKDWKALADKWMLNLVASDAKQSQSPHHQITKSQNMTETIQQLYELYLTGAKINKMILPEFYDHLQLEITETIKQEAIQRRINQLSGSNETATLNLWKTYMKEDPSDQLLINDEPNLIALAKRLAVSKHFQKLKSKGALTAMNTT